MIGFTIIPPRQHGAFGYWAPKPGSIMPDGAIVTKREGCRLHLALSGVVLLTPARAKVAQRYGWESVGTIWEHDGPPLVRVRR